MIETLAERVNADAGLVRRGRYVNLAFLLGVGEDDYIIAVAAGRVASVERRQRAMDTGRFAIRAGRRVWEEFWKPLPKRDHHDLFSMVSAGLARIDGDLLPLMQNLQYFKDLLAAPRPAAGEG